MVFSFFCALFLEVYVEESEMRANHFMYVIGRMSGVRPMYFFFIINYIRIRPPPLLASPVEASIINDSFDGSWPSFTPEKVCAKYTIYPTFTFFTFYAYGQMRGQSPP